MNTFVFVYVLLWGVSGGEGQSLPSLPVLYYEFEDISVLSELSLIERMLKDGDEKLLRFKHILTHCGMENPPLGNSTLYNKKFFENAQNALEQGNYCTWHYNPAIFHFEDNNGDNNGYSRTIGYRVKISTSTDPDRLPRLPSKLNTFKHVIWYELNVLAAYTVQTVHYFQAYKRSLLPKESCKDYTLAEGTEFENAIKELYEKKRQNEIFNNLKISNKRRMQSKSSEIQYLIAHPMVPIDDFLADSMRMAACTTYFTKTPIWQSVSEGHIKIVEEFIQRLAEQLYVGTLKIRTEIHDVLELKANNFAFTRKKIRVELPYDNNKLISVPKYFLKIVAYRPPVPYQKENYEMLGRMDRYYMIIVIHNELSDFSDRLCNKNNVHICKQHGWRVTNNGDENGSVYCCTSEDQDLKNAITIYDNPKPFNLRSVVTPISVQNTNLGNIDLATKLTPNLDESSTESGNSKSKKYCCM